MDEPSAQLVQELQQTITRELSRRRPLLHRLNADTSWLLQVPRPLSAARRGGRQFYNILIDPRLSRNQSSAAQWFSRQWHTCGSIVKSMSEVEELARETEILAGGVKLLEDKDSIVDVLVVSHEFAHHCSKETLLELDRNVLVFATSKARALISSWSYFRFVRPIPPFTLDWKYSTLPPLPEWLGISEITDSSDPVSYHSAILISFNPNPSALPQTFSSVPRLGALPTTTADRRLRPEKSVEDELLDQDAAESVIYTPHGVPISTLSALHEANPRLKPLALLHGHRDLLISAKHQLNLDALNALKTQQFIKAKYWIGTHDEMKEDAGLLSWLWWPASWVMRALKGGVETDEGQTRSPVGLGFVEVANGETLHLI